MMLLRRGITTHCAWLLTSLCTISLFAETVEKEPSGVKMVATDPLGQTLEAVYRRWISALDTRNNKVITETMSAHARVNIRNAIVSQMLPFPAAFYENPIRPPRVDELKFVHAIAVGRTAQAVYYGKVDYQLEGEDGPIEIPNNLLVLRFLKDGQHWKFDSTRMVNLKNMPDLEMKIIEGDYEFLNSDVFIPPGIPPLVPKQCPLPEAVGHFEILSIGFRTTIQINGFSQIPIENNRGSNLIIGGWKKGFNKVVITFEPVNPPVNPDGTRAQSEAGVRLFSHGSDPDQSETNLLFEYQPENVPRTFNLDVRVP